MAPRALPPGRLSAPEVALGMAEIYASWADRLRGALAASDDPGDAMFPRWWVAGTASRFEQAAERWRRSAEHPAEAERLRVAELAELDAAGGGAGASRADYGLRDPTTSRFKRIAASFPGPPDPARSSLMELLAWWTYGREVASQ